MEGHSYAEISEVPGVPVGTAKGKTKGWVGRGRDALLVVLAEEEAPTPVSAQTTRGPRIEARLSPKEPRKHGPKGGKEHLIEERRDPTTLEEAYHLRDSAGNPDERDFYQEKVYALRREEYQRRGIPTESSSRRRERRSAVEFSREVFLLEVADIAGRQSAGGEECARAEARREAHRLAARLDKHASPEQPDLHPGLLPGPARARVVELYRRNFLELLRAGKSSGDAYYLARVIGPVGDAKFGIAMENVRRTGYPRERSAYVVERAAIQVWDLPGGIILTLLAFFASLFALVWASANIWSEAGAGTIFVVVGPAAAGGLMMTSVLLAATLRSKGK